MPSGGQEHCAKVCGQAAALCAVGGGVEGQGLRAERGTIPNREGDSAAKW